MKTPEGRERRERGLVTLYRKSHPGAPYPQIHYNIEQFKRDNREIRFVKIEEWVRMPAYGEPAPVPTELRIIKPMEPYGVEPLPDMREYTKDQQIEELKHAVKERDDVIKDLLKRMEQLEMKVER